MFPTKIIQNFLINVESLRRNTEAHPEPLQIPTIEFFAKITKVFQPLTGSKFHEISSTLDVCQGYE